MSLYDREYMGRGRAFHGYPGWGGEFWRTPVGALIIANVAVFFFSFFMDGLAGAGRFFSLFELSVHNIEHFYLWTLVTYAFLHAGFLHILLNMIGLYFFGVPLAGRLGKQRFLVLYFAGAITAALTWLIVNGLFGSENSGMLGASGAVMAVFACFCLLAPERPLTFLLFFIIPITLRPIIIFRIAVIFEGISCLMFEILGDGVSNVAYSAHLGGLLAGYVAAKIFLCEMPSFRMPSFFKRRETSENGWQKPISFTVNVETPENMRTEIDRILNKISTKGFNSLTDSERETLRKAKDRLG